MIWRASGFRMKSSFMHNTYQLDFTMHSNTFEMLTEARRHIHRREVLPRERTVLREWRTNIVYLIKLTFR